MHAALGAAARRRRRQLHGRDPGPLAEGPKRAGRAFALRFVRGAASPGRHDAGGVLPRPRRAAAGAAARRSTPGSWRSSWRRRWWGSSRCSPIRFRSARSTALFGWWLLLIALLDLEHQWLPDRLTLPLIPLGLAAAWAGFGPPLIERAAGAAIGWAVLFLIAMLYRQARGREGMGGGDPKLLAAIGAWVGAFQLPFILLGAGRARAGGGAADARARRGGERDQPPPARHVDGAHRLAGVAADGRRTLS